MSSSENQYKRMTDTKHITASLLVSDVLLKYFAYSIGKDICKKTSLEFLSLQGKKTMCDRIPIQECNHMWMLRILDKFNFRQYIYTEFCFCL